MPRVYTSQPNQTMAAAPPRGLNGAGVVDARQRPTTAGEADARAFDRAPPDPPAPTEYPGLHRYEIRDDEVREHALATTGPDDTPPELMCGPCGFFYGLLSPFLQSAHALRQRRNNERAGVSAYFAQMLRQLDPEMDDAYDALGLEFKAHVCCRATLQGHLQYTGQALYEPEGGGAAARP
jgi:hypothetical protein